MSAQQPPPLYSPSEHSSDSLEFSKINAADAIEASIQDLYQRTDADREKPKTHPLSGRVLPPKPFVVYWLRCHQPTHAELLMDRTKVGLGREPTSLEWAAFHSDQTHYIGSTHDPYGRIQDHLDDFWAASFTKVFPPYQLLKLWAYDSEEEAVDVEVLTAESLRSARPEWFIYQK